MKFNEQELDETIQPIKQTDLIYGIEDRPPFKDALFAAVQHLLAIFVAIITPPLIIASALKLGFGDNGLFGINGFVCFGNIYIYSMSAVRSDRSRTTLYPGNKLFFYRSDYYGRTDGRFAFDFWLMYGGCSGRNDHQSDV